MCVYYGLFKIVNVFYKALYKEKMNSENSNFENINRENT